MRKVVAPRNPFLRWAGWFALALVFAIACWNLSQWQFARRNAALEVISRIDRSYSAPVATLEELVPNQSGFSLSNEYRLVSVTGQYEPEKFLLVRNRPRNGVAGFEQLVPLRLESGLYVFVNRGWLPTGNAQDFPDSNPLPEENNLVTVTARLRHSEGSDGRDAPKGQIARATIPEAFNRIGVSSDEGYSGVYLILETESPSYETPKLLGKPTVSEGNHLSYAFQWVLFALMAFGVLIWAVKQERLQQRLVENPHLAMKPKRRRLGQDDQDYEDAS